jgi:hypothetical protein
VAHHSRLPTAAPPPTLSGRPTPLADATARLAARWSASPPPSLRRPLSTTPASKSTATASAPRFASEAAPSPFPQHAPSAVHRCLLQGAKAMAKALLQWDRVESIVLQDNAIGGRLPTGSPPPLLPAAAVAEERLVVLTARPSLNRCGTSRRGCRRLCTALSGEQLHQAVGLELQRHPLARDSCPRPSTPGALSNTPAALTPRGASESHLTLPARQNGAVLTHLNLSDNGFLDMDADPLGKALEVSRP